ncbi:MAG: exo-alpha-sialidase [Solirubrobacterales bacterium]|nr:exo-alpha-sialidase [Solirubrobacterales bacterium]
MSLKIRLSVAVLSAAVLSAATLLLVQSHAAAGKARINYAHLTNIQKRIVSETLASALGPRPPARRPHITVPGSDEGGGPDGAPFTPPASFGSAGATGSPSNYFPSQQGQCSQNLGRNVKVNQNCLNVTDPDLQGRGQANNEPSISVDPFNSRYLVASDNNYIRGDGTCGSHFSLDGGNSWADTTIPNGFTRGPTGFARQYWQAGGDTSVAWDTRGNAYESCQLFNRGTVASPNPDQSSAFVVFRATQNHGASWNFPGRYTTVFFAPGAGATPVLEDKALMAIDDNVRSPYRDRIYVTWTEFAADGTAYIYEVHSDDYGETFSNRVLVSAANPTACTNTLGAATTNGPCNMNQFSDPFVGPDGNLYVVYDNFNNQPASSSDPDYHYQVLLSKSTDGGQTFSPPVKVSNYYDLPNCDTYQGTGADPGRSCVPEKGSSTKSVFRATNYPSGQVDPRNGTRLIVTFGSYINPDSNESNGCTPTGSEDGNPTYTGVKTPGACANKILLKVSTDGGASFTGSTDPRSEELVNQSPGQRHTDQFWQWAAFTRDGKAAVDYYDRQYGDDETTGSSDFSLSGTRDLVNFGQVRLTRSSMPAPTQFEGPAGGQFYGDYVWLSALDKAYAIWSDTREPDLFVCPGTATPGHPPALCGATETNGEQANDEDTFMTAVNVPTG